MKILYEDNWHYNNDSFSHCSVTEIKVVRESILPGCTEVSITAIDKDGHKFQGSTKNYFESEELAWKKVRNDLMRTSDAYNEEIIKLNKELSLINSYLEKLDNSTLAPEPKPA